MRLQLSGCRLHLAPTIVEAVKGGKINRFFVIGGCEVVSWFEQKAVAVLLTLLSRPAKDLAAAMG